MAARLNVFDQDTVDNLKALGIADVHIRRVEAIAQENAEYYAREQEMEGKVVWVLDLEDAEPLHEYLHRNRPGGYQHVHDALAAAIATAKRG